MTYSQAANTSAGLGHLPSVAAMASLGTPLEVVAGSAILGDMPSMSALTLAFQGPGRSLHLTNSRSQVRTSEYCTPSDEHCASKQVRLLQTNSHRPRWSLGQSYLIHRSRPQIYWQRQLGRVRRWCDLQQTQKCTGDKKKRSPRGAGDA